MRRGLSAPVGMGPSWIIIIFTPALSWKMTQVWHQHQVLRHTDMTHPVNHLQLFDGVSASPDHQPNLTGWNQHLLYWGSAFPITMKTRTISAAIHNLHQQSFGVPLNTHTHKQEWGEDQVRRWSKRVTKNLLNALWSSSQGTWPFHETAAVWEHKPRRLNYGSTIMPMRVFNPVPQACYLLAISYPIFIKETGNAGNRKCGRR